MALQRLVAFDTGHMTETLDLQPFSEEDNSLLVLKDADNEKSLKPSTERGLAKQPVFTAPEFEYDESEEPKVPSSGKGIKELMQKFSGNKRKSTAIDDPEETGFLTKRHKQFIAVSHLSPSRPLSRNGRRNDNKGADSNSLLDLDISEDKFPKLSDAPWRLAFSESEDGDIEMVPSNPLLFLHNEIVQFARFIEIKDEEKAARMKVANQATFLIKELFPEATVTMFGSVATGLCIPQSDVDLAVTNCSKDAIYVVSRALQYRKLTSFLDVVEGARIPVIKLIFQGTKYKCDICFGIDQSEGTNFTLNILKKNPLLKPLILVLKYFFAQRDLNNPPRGQFGSHFTTLSVISLLQHSQQIINARNVRGDFDLSSETMVDQKRKMLYNHLDLGSLLLEYFNLYGTTLNTHEISISLLEGGSYSPKSERSSTSSSAKQKQGMRFNRGNISLLNPFDESLDVGAGAFQYHRLRFVFQTAYKQLAYQMNEFHNTYRRLKFGKNLENGGKKKDRLKSILSAVIPSDEVLVERYLNNYMNQVAED